MSTTDAPDLKALRNPESWPQLAEHLRDRQSPMIPTSDVEAWLRALDRNPNNAGRVYTRSIDDAAALVEGYHFSWRLHSNGWAQVGRKWFAKEYGDPALALCQAFVDALIATRDREARDG